MSGDRALLSRRSLLSAIPVVAAVSVLATKEAAVDQEDLTKAVEEAWRSERVEKYISVTVAGQKHLIRMW